MDSVTAGIVAGVVSGLAGAVVSGIVTLRKVRSDLAAEYDRDLRTKRLQHYRKFWPEFAELATTKQTELSPGDLVRFSDALRTWYFREGGIYLSGSSMDAYNTLQREINRVTSEGYAMSERDLSLVRFFAASFRVRMTEDLGTRRRPLLFARAPLVDKWRRKRLRRRAEKAVDQGGYAGPRGPSAVRSRRPPDR